MQGHSRSMLHISFHFVFCRCGLLLLAVIKPNMINKELHWFNRRHGEWMSMTTNQKMCVCEDSVNAK